MLDTVKARFPWYLQTKKAVYLLLKFTLTIAELEVVL